MRAATTLPIAITDRGGPRQPIGVPPHGAPAPRLAEQQRLADQALSEADQAASTVDQRSSDADQAASTEGRDASRLEQIRADLEQRASDADQAAADADVLAGPPQSIQQAAASRRSRALRRTATADRLSAAVGRASANGIRTEHDADRDRASTQRDSISAERDAIADAREIGDDRPLREGALAPGAEPSHERRTRGRATSARARATAAEARKTAAGLRARELVHEAHLAIEESRDAARALEAALGSARDEDDRVDRIAARLPGAAARGELSLRYQPLYDLERDEVTGCEALLRWADPELGAVAPDEFIPVAEETGAIVPVGDWVLRTALGALAGWRRDHPERDLTVAVNVAPEQLLVGSFPDRVAELLAWSGVPATALTLEITERTLVDDTLVLRGAMQRLQSSGVRLSVDDLGTGFSSLGRLSTFPLDELKIDRIFVAGIAGCRRQRALVAGIVGMSSALDLRVVAEGIETREQLDILLGLGCDVGQGYLLARPLDGEALTTLLGPPTCPGAIRAA